MRLRRSWAAAFSAAALISGSTRNVTVAVLIFGRRDDISVESRLLMCCRVMLHVHYMYCILACARLTMVRSPSLPLAVPQLLGDQNLDAPRPHPSSRVPPRESAVRVVRLYLRRYCATGIVRRGLRVFSARRCARDLNSAMVRPWSKSWRDGRFSSTTLLAGTPCSSKDAGHWKTWLSPASSCSKKVCRQSQCWRWGRAASLSSRDPAPGTWMRDGTLRL